MPIPEVLFDDVVIRPARPGEDEIVLDLLAEAAAWLRDRGIAQWPARFPAGIRPDADRSGRSAPGGGLRDPRRG